MKNTNEKYYIGLDIGTSSVGWAVTDTEYNLLRGKGKDMWGVRLFDEAETSKDRRGARTARRRTNREKQRVAYLREVFRPAVEEKDPSFFQRLDDSFLHEDDKTERQPYALFADTGYTDVEYHKDYPTIYHLRHELITNKEPHDVRLVYLALLNIFKHRGHFLTPNLESTGNSIGSIAELVNELSFQTESQLGRAFPVPENIADLESILSNRNLTVSAKNTEIVKLLQIKDKNFKEICKFICGLKGKPTAIFIDDEADNFTDEDKKLSISFRDGNYDEKIAEVEAILSPEQFEIVLLLKQIYDWGVLASIMRNGNETYNYISEAKVASYEKHHKDLQILKHVYKEYLPQKYSAMFRKMSPNSYSAYVGSVNADGAKVRRTESCKAEDFFKQLKNDITKIPDNENIKDCKYILDEIELNAFLPKQVSTDNGVIPRQIHERELHEILNNAEGYLPFLSEKDESGLTAKERLIELFKFRVPYYVGPLKKTEGSNGWVVRNEGGTVYPWNIETKVNMKETNEKFIENLVRRCTYLNDEKVLPKNSLLYERYMVLDSLNNLKVNDEKVTVELKQGIYKDLFQKTGKRVTTKKLVSYINANGGYGEKITDNDVSGFDKEAGGFIPTLANYKKFADIFKKETLTDREIQIAEDVVFYATVYGDSRKFLGEQLSEKYGAELTTDQIKRICGIKFKDWGKYSKQLLLLEGADKKTGEVKTVIDRMWCENKNFMELMTPDLYTYEEVLSTRAVKQEKALSEITHDDLMGEYISAPVRRMVWQTFKVVREIIEVQGCEPERIFIEMTRSNGEKQRTKSRKKILTDLYKSCGKEYDELKGSLETKSDNDLKSRRLYLYYRQLGRCMYSGEEIELSELMNGERYDIEHIYPRSYTKDDSIENNLVLVEKEINAHKSDNYPIESDIREKQNANWKALHDKGFINDEKFYRLTRATEFSQEEKIKFVNRQLVETAQGTKVVAQIFTQVFSGGKANDKVIYVKAGNVSEFRQEFDLLKCREVNNFHHANDAYLNIVMGNVYFTKFTQNAKNFFKSGGEKYSMRIKSMLGHRIERGGCVAWEPEKSIKTVKSVMGKNTPIVTMRNYVAHGAISNVQIKSAKDAKKANGVGYMPIKAGENSPLADTTKYGGYTNISGAYFFLVEHKVKNKTVRTIESLPIYVMHEYEGKEGLERYCTEVLGLKDASVRLEKILMYSLLKINGFYCYLTGRTGNRLIVRNAVELCLKKSFADYVKKIASVDPESDDAYLERYRLITKEKNVELYDELLKKHTVGIYGKRPNAVGEKLRECRQNFVNLSLGRQCNVLCEIIKLSQPQSEANLKDIGLSEHTGKSAIGKEIGKLEECKLINRSATGLFEAETDLLTI